MWTFSVIVGEGFRKFLKIVWWPWPCVKSKLLWESCRWQSCSWLGATCLLSRPVGHRSKVNNYPHACPRMMSLWRPIASQPNYLITIKCLSIKSPQKCGEQTRKLQMHCTPPLHATSATRVEDSIWDVGGGIILSGTQRIKDTRAHLFE